MNDKHKDSDGTLVVIDMQPSGFPAAAWMLKPVLQAIDAAMLNNRGIILVEYDTAAAGPVAAEIIERVSTYARKAHVKKTTEDGSEQVIDGCLAAKLPTAELDVCGVTTDICVRQTAHGLASRLPDSTITVLKHACDCWQGNRFDWTTFSQLPNLKAV